MQINYKVRVKINDKIPNNIVGGIYVMNRIRARPIN